MPEPILVVDIGAFQSTAALAVGEQWRMIPAPPGEPAEPAELLARLRSDAADRFNGPVERLLCTDPGAGAPGELVDAGRAAGFVDVELLPTAVALVRDRAGGPDFTDGALVLALDLGATWSIGLVRVAGDQSVVLAWRQLPATGPGAEDPVGELVEGCAKLAREGEVAGTVLAGGWLRHAGLADHLRQVLPVPVRLAAEPEYAALRGAVRWAADADRRQVPAEPPRWRVEPLSWSIPDRDATVLRWLVDEGTPYPAGAVLAQVRTRTDLVYDLSVAADGALLTQRVGTGGRTGASLVAAVAPAVTAAAYTPPPHRHQWTTGGGWLLTPQRLVEWGRGGAYVHARGLADGAVAGQLRPDHGGANPRQARVFVDPAGRYCLLTWDLDGTFWLWDIAAAALRGRFTGPSGVRRILVNERQWRMAAEDTDGVSVGRYRRTAVSFWDLDSGDRIDRTVDDDWGRRHSGYADRSGADRLTTEAASADRRLRAVVGQGCVTLYETATDRPVFRTPPAGSPHLRTAFSADGRFLVTTWEADDRSTVDVWEL